MAASKHKSIDNYDQSFAGPKYVQAITIFTSPISFKKTGPKPSPRKILINQVKTDPKSFWGSPKNELPFSAHRTAIERK